LHSFSLVHPAIWGPSHTITPLGFKYFVTFSDDYLKCAWIWLMKCQPKLFSIFQMSSNEIKTQFGIPIRAFSSEYAREYFSNQFHQFMKSNGTHHQIS